MQIESCKNGKWVYKFSKCLWPWAEKHVSPEKAWDKIYKGLNVVLLRLNMGVELPRRYARLPVHNVHSLQNNLVNTSIVGMLY